MKEERREPGEEANISSTRAQLSSSATLVRESEQCYKMLLDNAFDGIYFLRERNYEYVNPRFSEITGYSFQELTSPDFDFNVMLTEKGKELIQLRYEARKQEKELPGFYHIQIKNKDGNLLDLEVRTISIGREDEVAVLGFIRDVTERKKAEEALRENETRYRMLLDNAFDGIYFLREKNYEYVNPRFSEITGYSFEELTSPDFDFNVMLTEKGKELIQLRYEARKQGKEIPDFYHIEIKNKGGNLLDLEVRTVSIGREGEVAVLGFIRDITERKRAEEALRESEEHFRMLIENASDIITILDAKGTITYNSPSVERVLGFRPEEMVGRSSLEFVHPDDHQIIHENLGKVIQNPGTVKSVEFRLKNRDDQWRTFDGSGQSWVNEAGEISVVANLKDITERKRVEEELHNHREKLEELVEERTAELKAVNEALLKEISIRKKTEENRKELVEELERSNKELEQFAYVASHDLQEPLRKVKSFSELLARRYLDQLDDKAAKYISHITGGATRMQGLIGDLLKYSRVTTQGRPFETTNCDDVLAGVMDSLHVAIRENDAVVTNDSLPQIMSDPTQLGQIFQNLIGNAIKFRGDEAPRIHVSATEEDGKVLFSVSDNGIGIDMGQAERIFTVFQRLHTRDEYPGTGIGLAVCKKSVERHGGRIWVESEPGRGSTFYFTIPVLTKEASGNE